MAGGPASVTAENADEADLETAMVSSGESGKIEKRMVVEYGINRNGVWLPLAMLRRLRTHGTRDAPFTEASTDQERVLLCTPSPSGITRPAWTPGTGLTGFLDAIPYEPTVSFPKLPAEGPDHQKRGQEPAG